MTVYASVDGRDGNRIVRDAFVRSAGQIAERQSRGLYHATNRFDPRLLPGQAFQVVPHTVRAREKQACSDCHVFRAERQTTAWRRNVVARKRTANFMALYLCRYGKSRIQAIAFGEHDEPEAVYGSDLQASAIPTISRNCGTPSRTCATAEHAGKRAGHQGRAVNKTCRTGLAGMASTTSQHRTKFLEKVTTAPVSPHRPEILRGHEKRRIACVAHLRLASIFAPGNCRETRSSHSLAHVSCYVADNEEGMVISAIASPIKGPGFGHCSMEYGQQYF